MTYELERLGNASLNRVTEVMNEDSDTFLDALG
jgi:hypothetical protein